MISTAEIFMKEFFSLLNKRDINYARENQASIVNGGLLPETANCDSETTQKRLHRRASGMLDSATVRRGVNRVLELVSGMLADRPPLALANGATVKDCDELFINSNH